MLLGHVSDTYTSKHYYTVTMLSISTALFNLYPRIHNLEKAARGHVGNLEISRAIPAKPQDPRPNFKGA